MRIQASNRRPGLEVVRDDGSTMAVHPLWLRERCADVASCDEHSGQRLYDPSDLDPAITPASIEQVAPDAWSVRFADGAHSVFRASELLAELAGAASDLPARRPWTAALTSLPYLRWIPHPSPAELHTVAETFLTHGFVIFTGVSREPGAVLDVARTLGVPRATNFGLLFDVKTQPSATDLAYTGLALDAHTDNPYRDPVPGIQLLHCLVNESTGGLSTLADGYAVSEQLQRMDPAAWDLLCKTPVRFHYRDAGTELVHHAPMIELDSTGNFAGIRFSPRLDFVPLLPPETLDAFYHARRTLDRMLRSKEFEIRFLLGSGDLVMFDNRRLLHGRTSFDPQQGIRHLQGCYIDIDGVLSLYRVLSRAAARDDLAA